VAVEPDMRNCTDNNSAALATVGMPPHECRSEQGELSQVTVVSMMFENISISPSSLPSNEEAHGFVGNSEHTETEYSVDHLNSSEHWESRAPDSCSSHETPTQPQDLYSSANPAAALFSFQKKFILPITSNC